MEVVDAAVLALRQVSFISAGPPPQRAAHVLPSGATDTDIALLLRCKQWGGDVLMPESLVPRLREACPLFAAEDERVQRCIASLLWLCCDTRRAHATHRGFASISKQDLRNIFGSDEVARRVLGGKYFLVFRGDNLTADGYTSAFAPAQHLLEAMEACMRDERADRLVDPSGRQIAAQRGAIAPRRARTGTASAWGGLSPAKNVPVSVEGMLQLLPFGNERVTQSLETQIKMARSARIPGTIPHRYTQSRSGRLFAAPPSLQSAPRPVRAAAMAGLIDYDFANCHFSAFSHLAMRAGMLTPQVNAYLSRKRELREVVAMEARITEKQAKACLIMVMYGAQLRLGRRTGPARGDWQRFAIAKEIGDDAARRLLRCAVYVDLHEEVVRTRKAVIEAHTLPGGFVTNGMRLAVHPTAEDEKFSDARLLAHILQGYEAAALREIVRLHGDRIVLCLHDGWVSRDRLDVPACEAAVQAATGIPFRIEEERLRHPMAVGPVRQVGDDEFSLEDQGLAEFEIASSATRSALRGWPEEAVQVFPHRFPVLTARPDWNFLPD